MLMTPCIYDPFEPCERDCIGCPRTDKPEPDWDHLRDMENENKKIFDGYGGTDNEDQANIYQKYVP